MEYTSGFINYIRPVSRKCKFDFNSWLNTTEWLSCFTTKFIRHRFALDTCIKGQEEIDRLNEELDTYLHNVNCNYSTFIILDYVSNEEYAKGFFDSDDDVIGGNGIHIMAVAIVEKEIFIAKKGNNALIHFIATHPNFQGQQYAKQLLLSLGNDAEFLNTTFHAIAKYVPEYCITGILSDSQSASVPEIEGNVTLALRDGK